MNEETALNDRTATANGKEKPTEVRLKEREFEVLSALEVWGILGLGQLEALLFWRSQEARERLRLFFNEYDRSAFDRYAYKRLLRLERAGYIQRHYEAYSLTLKGQAQLREARLSKDVDLRRSWSSKVIHEYLRMNGVGLVLARLLGLEVRSRHQLASAARAAGLSESRIKKEPADVRIEGRFSLPLRVRHSWDRREERSHWQTPRESHVPLLYLTSDWGKGLLLAYAKQDGMAPICVGELAEFRHKLGETSFINPAGQAASLDQLVRQYSGLAAGGG